MLSRRVNYMKLCRVSSRVYVINRTDVVDEDGVCPRNVGAFYYIYTAAYPTKLHRIRRSITGFTRACPLPEPNQSSLCPPPIQLAKIHFNIIFPSTPGSSRWSPSFRFSHKSHMPFSSHPYVLHVLPISVFLI
jgi:hypothetical protein